MLNSVHQYSAMPSNAQQFPAVLSNARQCSAMPSNARKCSAMLSNCNCISRMKMKRFCCILDRNLSEKSTALNFIRYLLKTRQEMLTRPKAPKIFQELLSNSEELKRFQRILIAQVLGQPKDSKGFVLLKYYNRLIERFQKIPKDSLSQVLDQPNDSKILKESMKFQRTHREKTF